MNKEELILMPETNTKEVSNTLEKISAPLEAFVKYNNLPTTNVLASNTEKAKLFNNFPLAIEMLPISERTNAEYLTKFVVSAAVGLFDGALSFLWDEIIKSLRKKIANYDLTYFYSVAEQQNAKYKNLIYEEDLQYISDYDFLSILKRIGLIDEIAFKTLENINYLRNNASAAHPNTNELSGLKLSSLLEDGIKYAILIEPDSSMITVKKLFNNIRTTEIPEEDFDSISEELTKMKVDRLNDFAKSIFGLYCDSNSSEITQKNIIEISKRIWENLLEETKYDIGARFGYYRKNGDVPQKERVNKFLTHVKGLKYKDSDSIVAEMMELLQQLRTVHFGYDNFYNEYRYAKDLENIIPNNGLPNIIKSQFVKIICICFAGNGCGYREGVDENALTLYKKFISKFDDAEIKDFILAFADPDFTVDFYKKKPDERIRKLAEELKNKTENEDLKKGLDIVLRQEKLNLANVHLNSEYQSISKRISSHI